MNYLFYSILFALFLISCTAPEKEEEGEILEYFEETLEEEYKADFPEDEVDFEDVESKHVLYCEIGLYEEAAIMVLDWGERDENGIYPIKGYYFYVNHQKNLDLDGYSEPSTRGIYLTESYKGKETGYMQFAQDAHVQPWDGENYWAVSKDAGDKQSFYSEDLLFTDPMDANLALEYDKYEDGHGITIYMGEEEGDVDEYVTDELNWVIINEEFFAFDVSTTGRNGHTGEANGICKIQGDKAIWIADDEDQCTLTFDLSNKEKDISVSEENCTYFHGAYAYFDGTYSK
jgi:hypothetical protein